ncbi:MAG: 16S rRNA (cytidine(1402)-2'-O)-methyltransferase [Vulcanimicrobiaceae bacterium]
MPLVFVPTPLGNLRDVTVRALEILRAADLVVAEDTRVARRLLSALDVGPKRLASYREQNAASVTPTILDRARQNLVAVVTDAGMPGVSDPGSELVTAARAAGIGVEVLPGPSAVLGVAVLSGFPLRRFAFEGFPPRTAGARRAGFARALAVGITTIWFESPQRIVATLRDLAAVAPDSSVFLVREYTKLHEQQAAGTPDAVAAQLGTLRGEIAFAVAPGEPSAQTRSAPRCADDVTVAIDGLLDEGRSVSEIAKALAERSLGARGDLYRLAGERKRSRAKVAAPAGTKHSP